MLYDDTTRPDSRSSARLIRERGLRPGTGSLSLVVFERRPLANLPSERGPDLEGERRASGFLWIVSYPKSGNTWVRLVLASLQRGGQDVDLNKMDGAAGIASSRADLERDLDICLADMTPEEISDLRPLAYRGRAKAMNSLIFVKVHDRYGATASGEVLFPPEITSGCLHIVRDPRDVCTSYAAHIGVSVDRAIEIMGKASLAGQRGVRKQTLEDRGSWSSHAASWLSAPVRRLTIRYEDLLADPLRRFIEAAAFCGLEATPAVIASAVEANEFSRLAARENQAGFRERPVGMERFFRSGLAGQWREALSEAQIRRIEGDHGEMMLRLGYELASSP